jgi:hypothetical protein
MSEFVQTYAKHSDDDPKMFITETEHYFMMRMREFYETETGATFNRNAGIDWDDDSNGPYEIETFFDDNAFVGIGNYTNGLQFTLHIDSDNNITVFRNGTIDESNSVVDFERTDIGSKFVRLIVSFARNYNRSDRTKLWLQPV